MPPQNVFSGISMAYDVVNHWRTYPGFEYFVFQPAIDDMQVGEFTLIAYAVGANFLVLNGGAPLPTTESNYKGFTGHKQNIQFANMHLSLKAVNDLYQQAGVNLPLHIYPAGEPHPYYKNTSYVQYEAATGIGTEVFQSTKVDPSPPA